MTPAECLAQLAALRATDRCRFCDGLDWALAQLQLVGDYEIASTAATLRAAEERLEPYANCARCDALDAVKGWLTLQPAER